MAHATTLPASEAFVVMVDMVAQVISPNCHWGAGYINKHVERRRENARAKAREVMRLTMGIPLGRVELDDFYQTRNRDAVRDDSAPEDGFVHMKPGPEFHAETRLTGRVLS
jgi:hypothetical protein